MESGREGQCSGSDLGYTVLVDEFNLNEDSISSVQDLLLQRSPPGSSEHHTPQSHASGEHDNIVW